MVSHILNKYAKMDKAERLAIQASMRIPWEGGPIELTIAQIEEGVARLLADGIATTEQDKCDIFYNLIQTSGLMPDATQKWRLLTTGKTWMACKDHFTTYAIDAETATNSAQKGYAACMACL